jgi:hypothetical protein
MADFQELISQALSAEDDRATQAFRSAAISKGWPMEISLQISLNLSLDGLTYIVPDEIQDQVNLLEYGDATTKTPPKAVMNSFERSFVKSLEHKIADSVSIKIAAELDKEFADL